MKRIEKKYRDKEGKNGDIAGEVFSHRNFPAGRFDRERAYLSITKSIRYYTYVYVYRDAVRAAIRPHLHRGSIAREPRLF